MAKVETWSCDICHAQKKSTNHWWKLYLLQADGSNCNVGAVIVEWDVGQVVKPIARPDMLPERADAHLCGIQHTLEWLSKNVLEKVL